MKDIKINNRKYLMNNSYSFDCVVIWKVIYFHTFMIDLLKFHDRKSF